MNQEYQISDFRKRIKEHLSDANKNLRSISPELKDFVDKLYQYILLPMDCTSKKYEKLRETDALIPRCFFLFFISQDGTEKASFSINTKKKQLYSVMASLSELKDVNIFMSVGTFYPNASNTSEGKSVFRRIKAQVSRINSIYADLDYYHMEGSRFQGMQPEAVFKVIKKENPNLFNGSIPISVIKSGNGLQIYLHCESMSVNSKRWYHIWKTCNLKWNELLNAYGADAHVSGDICRVLRVPNTYNVKKEPKRVEFLYQSDCEPFEVYQLLEVLQLTQEDIKTKEQLSSERASIKQSKKQRELLIYKLKDEKIKRARKEFRQCMENATTIEITEAETRRKKYSDLGKLGFGALTRKRLKDFEKILELSDYNIEGKRNIFLFLYGVTYHAYYRDIERLCIRLIEINELLTEPLDEKEVLNIAKHIRDGGYSKLTNAYIARTLELTEEDTEQLSICYTKEQSLEKERQRGKMRYYSQFEDGISNKRKQLENNAQIILDNMDKPNAVVMEMTGMKSTAFYKLKKKVRNGIMPTKK